MPSGILAPSYLFSIYMYNIRLLQICHIQWSLSPAGNEGNREAGIPDGLVMAGPLDGVHGRWVLTVVPFTHGFLYDL